ncbi:MAG: ATP-binding protein [Succinivibrio sp.]|nr:ATP-binding protein [Succinivibrio sp.]
MKLIDRPLYLQRLMDVKGTPDIKVITGIRRCGKSKLMESFIKKIKATEPDANIIHINFNLDDFEPLEDRHQLISYIESKYDENKNNYVFIDEVQNCKEFEKAINSLHAKEKYDIYITGSNAFLLSSDLATLFTGRTFKISVYPFSFAEFMDYFQLSDRYEAYNQYITVGGMPGAYSYKNESDRMHYIKDVFDTLILRDITQKYKIRNSLLLSRVSNFLQDNISNLTSCKNISDTLSKSGTKNDHKTVFSYLNFLCNAYAFYKITRFDIRGKKYLSTTEKYYLCDHIFRYANLGTKNPDFGRVMENIVAIELLRRGYEVYVGKLYQKEVDFVAIKNSEKLYIQVSDNIEADTTKQRELDPLLKIKDSYPKLLITRTHYPKYDIEGVMVVDIADWLLGNS